MHIPGPYSDDNWDWLPQPRAFHDARPTRKSANSEKRVVWELGLVLLAALAGTSVVGLVLKIFGIH